MAGKSAVLGIGLALAVILAAGTGWWGNTQHQRADQLAASLTASTGQVRQLQAQTAQLQGQITQLQGQLTQTQSQDAQLQGQLSQSQEQTSHLQTQVAQESKPDLPITVSYRHAVLGGGLVAVIRNNSRQPLEVAALFGNPATGSGARKDLVLPAQQVLQVGRLLLFNAHFRPYQGTVP